RAIGYYEQALAISREIGDRQSESIILENIGDLMVDQGNLPEAIHIYSQAIEIADDIGFVPMQNYGRSGLAKAHLFSRDLLKARATIEAACRYDVPQNNHNVWALYGVITLRQGDQAAAHKAFATAVE